MKRGQTAADTERLPWPDGWLKQTDSGDARACRALWAAALIACIKSSLDLVPESELKLTGGRHNVGEEWFGSCDFHMMCALAGVDGAAVLDRLSDTVHRARIVAHLDSRRKVAS